MVFGMGGSTSCYQETEETDCILLWGSNARETHPIFFHHLLTGVKRGAKLYAIDPRSQLGGYGTLCLARAIVKDCCHAKTQGGNGCQSATVKQLSH